MVSFGGQLGLEVWDGMVLQLHSFPVQELHSQPGVWVCAAKVKMGFRVRLCCKVVVVVVFLVGQ